MVGPRGGRKQRGTSATGRDDRRTQGIRDVVQLASGPARDAEVSRHPPFERSLLGEEEPSRGGASSARRRPHLRRRSRRGLPDPALAPPQRRVPGRRASRPPSSGRPTRNTAASATTTPRSDPGEQQDLGVLRPRQRGHRGEPEAGAVCSDVVGSARARLATRTSCPGPSWIFVFAPKRGASTTERADREAEQRVPHLDAQREDQGSDHPGPGADRRRTSGSRDGPPRRLGRAPSGPST